MGLDSGKARSRLSRPSLEGYAKQRSRGRSEDLLSCRIDSGHLQLFVQLDDCIQSALEYSGEFFFLLTKSGFRPKSSQFRSCPGGERSCSLPSLRRRTIRLMMKDPGQNHRSSKVSLANRKMSSTTTAEPSPAEQQIHYTGCKAPGVCRQKEAALNLETAVLTGPCSGSTSP